MRLLANGVNPRNRAFLAAIGAYIELVSTVRITNIPSGIYKLYLTQTGGVTLSDSSFSYQDIVQAYQTDKVSTLFDKNYVDYLIRLNIGSYATLLAESIINRISFLSHRPLPATTSAINTDRARKDHYWPSASTVRKLEAVKKVYNDRSGTPQRTNWLTDAASGVHQDVDYVVGMCGMASPNPVCSQVILDFVKTANSLLIAYSTTPYKEVYLPLLQILHDIARLLYGSVDQEEWESRTSMLPPDLVKMRISDVTLACIPAPTLELIAEYSEPDQTAVSTAGRQYLDKLTVMYTTEDTP